MKNKTINCSVHGLMTFSRVAMAVIDTPEYQRLRSIAQLGATSFVYPTASHSRFEHCLGTAHLGKLFITEIAGRQPELAISKREILCIELAGLCHDLGHGPFSHLWETFYETCQPNHGAVWHHEQTSVHILRLLLKRYRIIERFRDELDDSDVDMIGNIILGRVPEGSRRRFLYQIINNPDSGLDVDKWDYFLRDSHNLGVKIDFQYDYAMRNLEVLPYNGQLQVCFRDKCYDLIQQAFRNRFKLHKKAYQHPKIKIIDEMLIRALLEVEQTCGAQLWKTTNDIACDEPTEEALTRFIEMTDNDVKLALRKHSRLYRALLTRSNSTLMYRYAGMLPANNDEALAQFEKSLGEHGLRSDEVALIKLDIHMGRKDQNPMDSILFFQKNSIAPEYMIRPVAEPVAEKQYVVALRGSDPEKLERLKGTLCR